MLTAIAAGLAGLLAAAYTVQWTLSCFDDPREPPRLDPKFPLVGHLYGILTAGPDYYTSTSKRTNAEIYTLGVFHYKIYVVGTHRLTSAVQKCSKTLSFRDFLLTIARRWGNASERVIEILDSEPEALAHTVRSALTPGAELDAQNLRMGVRALAEIDRLAEDEGSPEFMLHAWARRIVVQSSSCGIFGERHPFTDPAVEAAFWEWQKYLLRQMAGVDVTGAGHAARAVVVEACRAYARDPPADASAMIREWHRHLAGLGMSVEDIGQQMSAFAIAALANTVPTLYWTVHELFARPELLAAVREQVLAHAVSGDGARGFTLDVAALKTACPLVLSVLQETQRTRHDYALIRSVTADTLLDGTHLLRKGHFLQVPGRPLNHERAAWGDAADDFDPHRFTPGGGGEGKGRDSPSSSSFVPWGCAPHLCPARQFAATEILIVVALLAVRLDLSPARGGGAWELRPPLGRSEAVVMRGPARDVAVRARRRAAFVGPWRLAMGESRTRIALASG